MTNKEFDFAIQTIYLGDDPQVHADIELYFSIFAYELEKTPEDKNGRQQWVISKNIDIERCPPGRFGDIDDQA